VNSAQPPPFQAGDFQPDGIGADINGGKSGHGKHHSLHG
jgi:hypothetical protein